MVAKLNVNKTQQKSIWQKNNLFQWESEALPMLTQGGLVDVHESVW
jgi:hypothetical protein